MKNIFLSVLIYFFPVWIMAQQTVLSVKEFSIENASSFYRTKELGNGYSSFANSNSDLNVDKSDIDSLLSNGKKNTYIGPVQNNGYKSVFLIKDVSITYKMRAGQLLIDQITNSESAVDSLANEILSKLKGGGSFDLFCKKYSFNDSKKFDCDLGWFNSGVMVKEFEQAVLEHKKGDIFRVKTIFGTHIVKVLEDKIENSRIVSFIEIRLK